MLSSRPHKTDPKDQAIINAIVSGNKQQALELIAQYNFDALDPQLPFSPLKYAVTQGQPDICLAMLIKLPKSVVLAKSESEYSSAFDLAVNNHHTGIIKHITHFLIQCYIYENQGKHSEQLTVAEKIVKQIEGEPIKLSKKELAQARKGELGKYYLPFENQCKRSHDLNKAAEAFLNEFNYLNASSDKRKGVWINLFGNKELTTNITQDATTFRKSISSMSNKESLQAFLWEIRVAINGVKEFRGSSHGNGLFEKSIIKGLMAAKTFFYHAGENEIDTLISEIKSYQPEAVSKNKP